MWWSIVGVIACIVALLFVISWFFRLHFLTISNVQIFGTDPDISDQIHDVVLKELNGNYLGLFPRANVLIYPKQNIETTIQSQFIRVQDISINHDGLTGLRITVNEKTPSAVVCATLPNFENNVLTFDPTDSCYFADSTGLLFEKSGGHTGHPYNTYYAPEIYVSGSSSDLVGSYATSTAEFARLQSFTDSIMHSGLNADAMLLKDGGEYELYSSSTVIYFNDEEGISDELTNLLAFWNHSVASDHTNRTQTVYDYIDLRYSPNVFYKVVK